MKGIKTGEDLTTWIIDNFYGEATGYGVNVTSKVRTDFLTGDRNGRFIYDGYLRELNFKSLGGGLWNATLKDKT